MASVLEIGNGYYGINTEGVTISKEVHKIVDDAFRVAVAVPTKELNIRLADEPVAAAIASRSMVKHGA
jgi:hypothetical protein